MNRSDEASTSKRQTVERKKSNLAFAFFCLDKERAKDMEIFYAFCRLMDDIADEPARAASEKRAELASWKGEISRIYGGSKDLSPLGGEMADVICRRGIPQEYIQAIIDGVMRDTVDEPFRTFEDIRNYCYGVASAVGLASIYIFGFKNPRTKLYAEALGYALQFTNILRDVAYDMSTQNRCYIPLRELEFFGVERGDLSEPSRNPNSKELFRMMHFRAKHFFRKADRLLPPEDRAAMKPAFIMGAIYEKILDKIAESDFNITRSPIKLSKPKKIAIALSALRNANRRAESGSGEFGSTCVLGGGISGICAALKLALEGFDVSLFEARASLGGRASAIDWNGARLDNGSHAVMGCYQNFFGFLKLIGVSAHDAFERAKEMDFSFPGGKKFRVEFPRPDDGPVKKFFAFLRYLKVPGLGKAANVILLAKLKLGLGEPKGGQTALEYLKESGIDGESIKVFWEPFCVSALNTTCAGASAKLMVSTLRKSVLSGGESGILYFPETAVIDAFIPRAVTYLESVGAEICLSDRVEEIEIKNGRFESIKTAKRGRVEFRNCVSALPAKVFANMLPEASALRAEIGDIKSTDIINVYFTTNRKLTDGDYACLVGSKLHWIFDHTRKSKECEKDGTYLYGATISDAKIPFEAENIRKSLRVELTGIFGRCEIIRALPSLYRGATISGDCASEKARPDDSQCGVENLHICGDWVQTGLPCTMESAAKSVNDMTIFKQKKDI